MKAGSIFSRRGFLKSAGCIAGAGFGLHSSLSLAATLNGGQPLAPRPSPHAAKAKHLIFVFLTGGMSHVDTFDPKPRLRDWHGRPVAEVSHEKHNPQHVVGSPFNFKACGQSGLMISELFPTLGSVADDLCVIRTLHTDIVEHFQATLAMHTGSATIPLPSVGSWLSYGLGTLNPNLPSFVVLAEHLPYAGAQVYDCSFLPPYHQGVRILPGEDPIPNLRPPIPIRLHELEQIMLRDVNEAHARLHPGDINLRARMGSFETAEGMMHAAPEVFSVDGESLETLNAYGITAGDKKSFAWQCLMARRLVENGVRVVELIDTGSGDNWDSHNNMEDHRPKARRVDRALAALISDLKRRGLLSETLVVCCTEFGRSPWSESPGSKGRGHYAAAFTGLLVGAGVKGGITYGETDDLGANIIANPVHVHDYHATMLHLMGIDHEKLTYRYAGRDFRLTDVSGRILSAILA